MEKSSEIAKKNKKKYDGKYYNSSFATILRGFLKKKEFNQQQLAKELKVSRQTISLYANGNSLPDIETLKKIIEYFKKNKYDYSSDYWLGLIDEPSANVKMKAINKKYGLSEKALENLKEMKEHKYFGDTILDTTNKLLEQDFYKNNDGSAIISLIDNYLEENGDGKALKIIRRNGMETTIRGQDVIKTFLLILENELINMKEGEKNECKRTRKK